MVTRMRIGAQNEDTGGHDKEHRDSKQCSLIVEVSTPKLVFTTGMMSQKVLDPSLFHEGQE